jgi:ectoine hydroxylase-related dioxygenase (phytanoyl-CoA dioxygenase family)
MLHLTPEQRRRYEVDGFFVAAGFLGPATLSSLYAAVDEVIDAAGDEGSSVVEFEEETIGGTRVPRRIFHPFENHSVFRDLAVSPQVIEPVKELLGPNLALQHSKLNMKSARVGAPVEWHQDMTYFPHTNTSLVALLIYLDDATIDNGCLQVLPGHHNEFLDHALPDGSFAGMITERIDSTPVTLEGPAGTAIFVHPLTPHRSLENRSSSSRRVLIYQYRAADAFPIYNGRQIVWCEQRAHHLTGEVARFARFGGVAPAIYFPANPARSIFELQASSRTKLTDNPKTIGEEQC